MSKFWNEKINNITPYIAGEQPKAGQRVIKLNTNENPYPPSPKCREVLDNFDIDELRLYPDTSATAVREAVAVKDGVLPSQVFVGNGSDEVLALCWQTFFEKKSKPVLTPDIGYSFYPVYSDFYDVNIEYVPLGEGFVLNPDDYTGRECGGIAIANPNAPTSLSIGLDAIKKIASANPEKVVLIDEAYAAFKDPYETAVSLLSECPNIVVVRTLSKSYGLAGLRVGYAIASAELIEGLLRARDSFNSYPVDRLAQKIAAAAISDSSYYEECRQKVIKTRGTLKANLENLGFEVLPSSSNFLFAKPLWARAENLYKILRGKGILVRYFNKPVIGQYLRITVGTDEECGALCAAIREVKENGQNG